MEVYNISVCVPETNRRLAAGIFAKDILAPYLTRYDNVSYLSQYDDGTTVKTLFDIGLNNLALGFRGVSTYYGVTGVLCKKTDTDNDSYLKMASCSDQGFSENAGTRFNCALRVIARDNKLIAVNLGKAGIASEWWLVIDNDNYGREYVMFNGYSNVYYDDDTFTNYQLYNANSAISNPMEGVVLESLLSIYNSNMGLMGLSTNLKSIMNVNLPTAKGSVIDVAGVKYVAMDMKNATAHQNVWVYDKEYGM